MTSGACNDGPRDDGVASGGIGTSGESADGSDSGDDPEPDDALLDVGDGPGGGGADSDGVDQCKVLDELDAPGDCDDRAPADSFNPQVQWTWTATDGNRMVAATPLVANLTDDNGDGEIDLCDIPDIIVPALSWIGSDTMLSNDPSYLYVLDGATGQEHYKIEMPLAKFAQPAVGDLDNDGIPEIVAIVDSPHNTFAIWEHDGTLKLLSETAPKFIWDEAIALADLDADGDVEIIMGEQVFDHEGHLLWFGTEGAHHSSSATVAADLDGDGLQEVVVGHSAFRHDGELYWVTTEVGDGGSSWASGYPQIANLDDDDDPEILLMNEKGISVLEHDGEIKYMMQTPTGDSTVGLNWARPAAVHDFDGDGDAEFAVSSSAHYAVYEADASIIWVTDIDDPSGSAAGTAFDFLGDGAAEAMYADEHNFFTYDGRSGDVILSQARLSRTIIEYPVVADIDNDGSAEVLVVSNETIQGDDDEAPALMAIRDAEDRWVPARRIWNQHAYHVTNVREDGTIPAVPAKHWLQLNTFRVQAQIDDGGICDPPVEG